MLLCHKLIEGVPGKGGRNPGKGNFLLPAYTKAELLDEIQTKLKSFPPWVFKVTSAACLEIYISPNAHATSYSFYKCGNVHCKGESRKS
jgi:hypothetical protein